MFIENMSGFLVKYVIYITIFQIIEANEHDVDKGMSEKELSKYFGVDTHDQVPDYDITHPTNVDQDGQLLSYHHSKVPHRHKNIHYNISAFGDHFNLHLEKNKKLFKHDLHVEVLGHNGKVLKKQKVDNCFYHGYSKNHRNSKVALSNCNHLSGVINTVEHSYIIQPLPQRLRERFKRSESDSDIAHIIYRTSMSERRRRSLKKTQNSYCETEDVPLMRLNRSTDIEQPDSEQQQDGGNDPEKYIETLLVVDDKMCAFHGEDAAKQFALSACNIASGLLKDDTIGSNPINLIITKMQIHTVPQDGLLINNHAMNSLSSFGKWAERNTVPDDTDPQHYDYATLFTRYDICKDKTQPCDTLGVSNVGGMCQFPHSVSICKDNGLMIGRTLAHETGHALGMNHDERPFCGDSKKMMSLHSEGSEAYEWSKCSRMFLRQFLDSKESRCLDDRPMLKHVINLDMFNEPGLLYDADQQCSLAFGDGAKYCNNRTVDEICTKLWCSLSDDDHTKCRSLNQPMAEGTPCGKTKWCKRGKCIDKNSEGLEAVDGGWSSWSVEYTPCTRSCSNGVQYRTRQCNNPSPSNGGKHCEGEHREYRLCNTQVCKDYRNFRDIQCAEKNKEMFNDKFFEWEWRPSNLKNKCTLGCFIKDTNKGYAFGNVEDGTDCDEDSGDKCVNGECVHVGCDGVFGSLANLDRCGICDGDGSTCSIDNSTEKAKKKELTNKYKEQGHTFKKTLSFLKTLGYDVPESYVSADTDEVISEYYWALVKTGCSATCGQGTELSRSECRRSDDSSPVAQKYCDIKKKPREKTVQCNRQQCKPEWRTDRWDDCSKSCNGGKRTRHVKCVQMIGNQIEFDVEEEMCDPNTKPTTEEQCNEQECAAEWVAKPFGKCSTSCGRGVQIRKVTCQKVSKEGDTNDVDIGKCADFVKPTMREFCNVHNPCPGQGKCGGTYTAAKGYLTSPNFPETYPNDKECMHSITVPQNKIVKLDFNSFDLNGNENSQLEGSCTGDFIRVKDSACEKFEGAETLFCGDKHIIAPYLSTGNKLCLKFYSDESSTNNGFNATFEAVDHPVRPKDTCGSDITASVGLLTSPNYPEPYPDNEICNMTIKTLEAPIKLNFQYFDVGENGNCNDDFVLLHGSNSQAERICGNKLPKLYTVNGTTLQLSFISGQQNKKGKLGFVATYTSGKDDAILKSSLKSGKLSAPKKIQNKTKKQVITARSKLQDLVDSLRDTIPRPDGPKPKVQFFPISSNSIDSKEVSAQQVSGGTPKVLFISDTKQQNKTDEAKKSEANITTVVDSAVNNTTKAAENNTENGKTRQFISRPIQSVLEQQGSLIVRGQCPHPQKLSCINLLYSYPCSGINDNSCATRGMDCCPTSCEYGPNMCVPKVGRECPLLTPYLGGKLDTCALNSDCHENYICCVDMLGRKYCRKQREID